MRRPQASPLGHPDLWHMLPDLPVSPGPPVTFFDLLFLSSFLHPELQEDFSFLLSVVHVFSLLV